jgi:hypothetical protein
MELRAAMVVIVEAVLGTLELCIVMDWDWGLHLRLEERHRPRDSYTSIYHQTIIILTNISNYTMFLDMAMDMGLISTRFLHFLNTILPCC